MFDELKNSWKEQEGQNMPSVEEISKLISGNRSNMFKKTLFAIFFLLLTVAVLFGLKYFIPFPNPITEYAIFAIIIIVMMGSAFLFNMVRTIPQNMDELKDVNSYIRDWVEYQERIKKYSNLFIPFYMISMALALAIYLWDITASSNLFRLIAYTLTFGWICYVWLVLTPKAKKVNEQKIDEIIDGYKRIEKELERN